MGYCSRATLRVGDNDDLKGILAISDNRRVLSPLYTRCSCTAIDYDDEVDALLALCEGYVLMKTENKSACVV